MHGCSAAIVRLRTSSPTSCFSRFPPFPSFVEVSSRHSTHSCPLCNMHWQLSIERSSCRMYTGIPMLPYSISSRRVALSPSAWDCTLLLRKNLEAGGPRYNPNQSFRAIPFSNDKTPGNREREKVSVSASPVCATEEVSSRKLVSPLAGEVNLKKPKRIYAMAPAQNTEESKLFPDGLRGPEMTNVDDAAPDFSAEDDGLHKTRACSPDDLSASIDSPEEARAKHSSSGRCRKLNTYAIINRARNRSEKRRKGASIFAGSLQNELPDLLAVPGIGPRNFEKLVAKGIGKVAELKQLYRDKFLNDESQKMVEFLQSSVGIVHKHHAESITSYVKDCVDKEQIEQSEGMTSLSSQKKKVTICVEGNISVGKTTFLQKIANEIIELRDLVEIVPEPVDKWKDVGPDHFNLLDAFYNEPERYAYTFQNYVFATRLMKEQETSRGIKPLRLMERSIFSDRLVFVRAVHEAKWMSELELCIYESWFDPFISALPGLVPDGFIYLRASPDTCLQRLHMRNRPEEQGVTLEYLRGLHEKHEQCFFPSQRTGGIYSVNRFPSGPHRVPPSPLIRDQVFYLEGDHLHSSIRKVPALILDCEASIDFNRDLEARAEYAQRVAEFYEYIKNNKDLETNTISAGITNPFFFPSSGGLLKPDGGALLHSHGLDGFNFRQHSSTL